MKWQHIIFRGYVKHMRYYQMRIRGKYMIYIYGMEGLRQGLELGPRRSKADESKEEIERLLRMNEEEKVAAHFRPSAGGTRKHEKNYLSVMWNVGYPFQCSSVPSRFSPQVKEARAAAEKAQQLLENVANRKKKQSETGGLVINTALYGNAKALKRDGKREIKDDVASQVLDVTLPLNFLVSDSGELKLYERVKKSVIPALESPGCCM